MFKLASFLVNFVSNYVKISSHMNDRDQKIKEFKALDDISHVLTVPARYIGSVNSAEIETYVLEDNRFVFKTISYTPGLLKCIEEILDNSVDAYLNSSDRSPITVKVNMTKTSVEVIDTGCGIPVTKYKDETGKLPELNGKWLPELAWGRLKAGGSFKEHRVGAGTHGEGSSLTNIFSTLFIGTTDDGKKKCKVTCKNNMHDITTKCSDSSGKTGTTVYFEPDLKRFNLTEITQSHFDLIYQRLVNLAVSFPELKFYFNGTKININAKNFIKMFSENCESVRIDNTLIGVFPSTNDEFQHYSYVNGLRIKDGGVHVDYVAGSIIAPIRQKLERKFKNIKPADIKNRLSLIVFMNDFANPQFNSQTKDELKNPVSDVVAHINGGIDFEKFAKAILKNEAIINPIVDMFRLKEELKAKQELKSIKKIRVKTDKYMSPIGEKKYCLLCEGLSARGGLSSALGRKSFGYFAGRGVPLNAYDSTIQAISANQELKDIAAILELDLFGKEAVKTISFDKIVLANDADMDGIFIANQYVGWFTRFAPNLFKEHKIARLITPLVILRDNKDRPVQYFYSLNEFKQYESCHDLSKVKIDYKKGLGSWPKDEFIELFDKYGFEYFIQDLEMDDEGKIYVNDWLSGNEAEKRKQYLREYTLNTEML